MDAGQILEFFDGDPEIIKLFHQAVEALAKAESSRSLRKPPGLLIPVTPEHIPPHIIEYLEEFERKYEAGEIKTVPKEECDRQFADLHRKFRESMVLAQTLIYSSENSKEERRRALELQIIEYASPPEDEGRLEALRLFEKARAAIMQELDSNGCDKEYPRTLRKLDRIWQTQVDSLEGDPPFRLISEPDYSDYQELREQQRQFVRADRCFQRAIREERRIEKSLLDSIADLDPANPQPFLPPTSPSLNSAPI